MTFQINPYVHEQNHFRSHAGESWYIDDLRRRGLLLEIDNVMVDAEQLFMRTFNCNIDWCLRCEKEDGKNKYKGSCCTDLEVNITVEEKKRLHKLANIAAKKLPLEKKDPLTAVVKRIREDDFTEITAYGEMAFGHSDDGGRCPLSWMEKGSLRCSINTLTSRLGLNLVDYKPEPCFLFPLHYVEYEPGKYFLTLISKETHEYIGADKYVTKLRCLRKPEPGTPASYISLKWEIIYCFGEELWNRIEKASGQYLDEDSNGEAND